MFVGAVARTSRTWELQKPLMLILVKFNTNFAAFYPCRSSRGGTGINTKIEPSLLFIAFRLIFVKTKMSRKLLVAWG